MSGWIAELSPGCWLASWTGDPGRTMIEQNAKRYKSQGAAKAALTRARKAYRFRKIKGAAVWSEDDQSPTLVTDPPQQKDRP